MIYRALCNLSDEDYDRFFNALDDTTVTEPAVLEQLRMAICLSETGLEMGVI